jgi:hypothetical protein
MKTGWALVIATGFLAALARLAGPASLADLTAIGYLLLATLMFDRGRRIESGRLGVPARSRDPQDA